MTQPVIVEAVRTPLGKRNGMLAGVDAAELLGAAQLELIKRTGFDPSEVEQIFGGCVSQTGEQSFNIARTAWLNQGFPFEMPPRRSTASAALPSRPIISRPTSSPPAPWTSPSAAVSRQ